MAAAADGRAATPWRLPDLVKAVRPSVVAVGYFRPTDNPRFTFRGSGFVVMDGRHIITNAHTLPPVTLVARQGDTLMVAVSPQGRGSRELREATLVAVHPRVDLALWSISGAPLPALNLAAGQAAEGQPIALMGFPLGETLGLNAVVHRGVVSAIVDISEPAPQAARLNARQVQALRAGSFSIYQLDATAYPGNSGGPLLDTDTGEVVGVVNMVLVKGTREAAISDPTGISYAIPAHHALDLIRNRGRWAAPTP